MTVISRKILCILLSLCCLAQCKVSRALFDLHYDGGDDESDNDNDYESSDTEDNNENGGMMNKMLPMFVMPFMLQTAMAPMMLMNIKHMLFNSIILGKFAIIFWVINLIRNSIQDQEGQFHSHNVHIEHG
ncbi:hypothetical protein GWI33_017462 [Rhynchophorus ferrugineus]|uniref:Uncharacterized protein n=1 Tax=Rhynchophorus ferrugineus TaxID=354439 RepID=A0A834M667_RHYFE|nr:hypothetical protein GWI33_017462 [Rhynchophorus ferrugineus]